MRLDKIGWLKKVSQTHYFPALVSIAVMTISVLTWYNLNQLRLKQHQRELETIAQTIGRELEQKTAAMIAVLANLEQQSRENWPEQISIITQQFPNLKAIATVNTNQQLTYILPCNCESIVSPIILEKFPSVREITVTSTFEGRKDNPAFLIYVPSSESDSEYLVAVIDLQDWLVASQQNFPDHHLHLREQEKLIYHSDLPTESQGIVSFNSYPWELVVSPQMTQNHMKQLILTRSVLVGGVAIGGLLGISLWLCQKLERHKQARQESERLFMEVQDLCCIANFDGYFQKLNPAWSRNLGYSESELLTQPYLHFIHPDDRELTEIEMNKLINGEKFVNLENRYRHRDGSYRIFSWRATANLESALIYAVARDITEETQAKQALDQHRRLLNDIVTNLPVIVYSIDNQGIFTLSEGQGLTYLQLKPNQVVGQSVFSLYREFPEILEFIRRVLEGNQCTWQATVNGRFYVNNASPLKNAQGEIIGLTGIAQDLTAQQQLQHELQTKEVFLGKIINTISDAILVVDSSGCILFFNPSAVSLFGSSESQLQNHQLSLPLVKGKSKDIYLLRPDQSLIIVEIQVETMQWQNQNAYLVSLRDITQRKQAEEQLQKNEERLEGILNSLQDIVWSIEPVTHTLIYINPAATRILGYSLEKACQTPGLWFKIMHPEDIELVRSQLQLLELKNNQTVEFEYRLRDIHGDYHYFDCRAWSVFNSQGEIIRIDGIESDITVKKQTEKDLEHRRLYDELTNLPNRTFFVSHLEYLCANLETDQTYRFALLILDLDEFKIINDSLGHRLGDKLLQAIALSLKSCLTPADFIARLGGDEFGILLEDNCDLEEAIALVKTIQTSLAQSFQIEDNYSISVKTSIGIAFSDQAVVSPETLLRNADTALNRAKAMGKNNYAIFNPQMHSLALNRLERELDLRYALEHSGFVLHYQPIVSLLNRKILGFEALVRLLHPNHGLLYPGDFIGIAEETGLIVPIGMWVLRAACQQLKQWQQRFPEHSRLKLSVNLSPRQFDNPDLISSIEQILQEEAVEPQLIKLEITESLFMDNIENAINVLQKLKKRNLKICVDDFGTGYSSLSYLHRFPVNTLKIDRCFVSNLETSVESMQIIKIIINLAHSLGLDTIAEGIETEAQLQFLKEIGCDQGQGYLFAKPLDVATADTYLSKGLTPRGDNEAGDLDRV